MIFQCLDYPLGQPALATTQVRRRRPLPLGARVLVRTGDVVKPDQPLYETAREPSAGHRVLAGVAGRITAVVPDSHIEIMGTHAVVQGIAGAGGTVTGPLVPMSRNESPAVIDVSPGSIVYYPHPAPLILLQRAVASGAVGVIAPSMPARELEAFLRADLTTVFQANATSQYQQPLTIIFLEGIGSIPISAFMNDIMAQRVGQIIAMDGTTHLEANQRPEILMAPLTDKVNQVPPAPFTLETGSRVLVAGGQWRGLTGTITWLYQRAMTTGQGWTAPAATVLIDGGSPARVPVHALVRIE